MIVRIAILGITLGLGIMILSVAIVKGFKNEIEEKVSGFSGDMQVKKFDLNSSYENAPFTVESDFSRKILATGLIKKIMPYATKPGIIKANDEIEGVVLKGVDRDYDWTFFKQNMVAGRVINFTDSAEAQQQILISQSTANRMKLKVGDSFLMYFVQEPLRRRKFNVVGIFSMGVEEVDKTYVVGDLSIIRRLNNWEANQVGGYELRAFDFSQLDKAEEAVNDVLPSLLKSYTVKEAYPQIFEWLSLLDINAQVMLALMMAVAVINMISALLIMILERTSMIGMLKAMGATHWNIQKIFLYNAAYLIGLGLLFGNVLGLGLGYLQYKTHVFKLDQASYYMSFVPIQISISDVILLNLAVLVICVLILLIPSTLVAKISPVKAIRFK